jgi:hypothetical protein
MSIQNTEKFDEKKEDLVDNTQKNVENVFTSSDFVSLGTSL